MSTTVFPLSLTDQFEHTAVETDNLRPLVDACLATMGDMHRLKAEDPEVRRVLPKSALALIDTALSLAGRAKRQHEDLAATLTHLAALYPTIQGYQRQLGVHYDDTSLDLEFPDWLADAPAPDEVA